MSQSFDEAFPRLFGRAVRLGLRLLDDHGAAEEVAAEALTRAYARWSSLADREYLDAWVLRVAANLALDRLRRRRTEVVEVGLVDFEDELALRVTLQAALDQLPVRQRQIVSLRYLADLSEAEVVRVTGLSVGTVRTHLRRAISALRRHATHSSPSVGEIRVLV